MEVCMETVNGSHEQQGMPSRWEVQPMDASRSIHYTLANHRIHIGDVLLNVFLFLPLVEEGECRNNYDSFLPKPPCDTEPIMQVEPRRKRRGTTAVSRQCLLNVSSVCKAWRFYVNILPHWEYWWLESQRLLQLQPSPSVNSCPVSLLSALLPRSTTGDSGAVSGHPHITTMEGYIQERARLEKERIWKQRLSFYLQLLPKGCCDGSFAEHCSTRLLISVLAVSLMAILVGFYFAAKRIGRDAVYVHHWSADATGGLGFLAGVICIVIVVIAEVNLFKVVDALGVDDDVVDDVVQLEDYNTLMFGITAVTLPFLLWSSALPIVSLLERRSQLVTEATSSVITFASSHNVSSHVSADVAVVINAQLEAFLNFTNTPTSAAPPSPFFLLQSWESDISQTLIYIVWTAAISYPFTWLLALYLRPRCTYAANVLMGIAIVIAWNGVSWIGVGGKCLSDPDNTDLVMTMKDACVALIESSIQFNSSAVQSAAFFSSWTSSTSLRPSFCMISTSSAIALMAAGGVTILILLCLVLLKNLT